MISSQQVVQSNVVFDKIGGSAKATGEMVKKLGAELLEYAFIMELTFLHGWKNLDAPVWRLVTEAASSKAGYVNAN